jgi:hypothetical protein
MSDAVIKDEHLSWYLMGKILVKPDYGYDTQVVNLTLMQGMANMNKALSEKVAADKKNKGYRR